MISSRLLFVCILFLIVAAVSSVGVSKCFRASSGVDFVSDRIELFRTLKFGGCDYNYARVASNGYITFGSSSYLAKVPDLTTDVPIIAAYGADMDAGLICYDHWYNETWAKVEALALINQWHPLRSSRFSPDFIFSVAYYNVKPYSPAGENVSLSVMLVMASGQLRTHIFTMPVQSSGEDNRGRMWPGSAERQVVVGYSAGNQSASVIITASPLYTRNFNISRSSASSFSYDPAAIARVQYSSHLDRPLPANFTCTVSNDKSVANGALLRYSISTPIEQSAPREAQSIIIPIRLRFGSCDYSFAQISTNGFIRLLRNESEAASQRIDYPGHLIFDDKNPIIAPFAADATSVVSYHVLDRSSRAVYDYGQIFGRSNSSFLMSDQFFMLIVTFSNISPMNRQNVSITAQAVLASNGSITFVVFSYDRDFAAADNWPGNTSPKPEVSIGFSYGANSSPRSSPNIIALLPNSHSAVPGEIDYDYARGNILGNSGKQGRWIYKIQTIGGCVNPADVTISKVDSDGLLINSYADLARVKSKARIDCLSISSDSVHALSSLRLAKPVPFGACVYSHAHVSSFGSISLGMNSTIDESFAGYHMLMPGASHFPLISPFSGKLSSEAGKVCYSQHTNETSSLYLRQLTSRIIELAPASALAVALASSNQLVSPWQPDFAFVVTWNNVSLRGSRKPISFQAAIVSDGTRTGVILLHARANDMFRTDIYSNTVGIGFAYGVTHNPLLRASGSLVLASPRWPQSSSMVNISTLPTNTRSRNAWFFDVDTTTGYCLSPIDAEIAQTSAFPNLIPINTDMVATSTARVDCWPRGDDNTYGVNLISSLPLGGCDYFSAMHSTNGWIAFGHPPTTSSGRAVLKGVSTPTFAIFNADLMSPTEKTLCVSQHNSEDDPTIAEIRNRLRLLKKRPFNPRFAVLFTYNGSVNYANRSEVVTFQGVFFTDGVYTQFFLNYDENFGNWNAETSRVVRGFSYGIVADRNETYLVEITPELSVINPSKQSNTGKNGVLFFEAPVFPEDTCMFRTTTPTPPVTYTLDVSNFLPSPQTTPNRLFDNAACLRNAPVDDYYEQVTLPFGVLFGGCIHDSIFINSNGFIVFSNRSYQSGLRPPFDLPVFLALQTDLVANLNNSICWSTHSSGDNYLELINAKLGNYSMPGIRSAVVVTFKNLRGYSNSYLHSFQMVIFTSGTDTQFLLIYSLQDDMILSSSYMGYSYGSAEYSPVIREVYKSTLLGPGITGEDGVHLLIPENIEALSCPGNSTIAFTSAAASKNLLPLSNLSSLASPGDDAVTEFGLQVPLPFAGCSYNTVYVSTNGYVSLGGRYSDPYPEISRIGDPIFMPFATDLSTEMGGVIYYSAHYENDDYLQVIENQLNQLNKSVAPNSIKVAVVISFIQVRNRMKTVRSVSCQFVIFNDGQSTRFFFLYSTVRTNWEVSRRVQIGFSYGRLLDPQLQHSSVTTYSSYNLENNTIQVSYLSNTGKPGVLFYEPLTFVMPSCVGALPTRSSEIYSSGNASNILSTESSTSSDCSLFGDENSKSFDLFGSIPFGGCNYSRVTVFTNGRIHLAVREAPRTDAYPFFSLLETDLEVPFGKLCVSQHHENSSLLSAIDTRLSLLGRSPVQNSWKYAVVVTYSNVSQYQRPESQLSFQFVLFTDGVTNTGFFYIYNDDAEVQVTAGMRLCVGHSYGTRNYSYTSQFDQHNCYPSEYNFTVQAATILGSPRAYGTYGFSAVPLEGQTCGLLQAQGITTARPTLPTISISENFLPVDRGGQFCNCLIYGDDREQNIVLVELIKFGGCQYGVFTVTTNGIFKLSNENWYDKPEFKVFQTDLVVSESQLCVSQHLRGDQMFERVNQRLVQIGQSPLNLTFAVSVTYYSAREYSRSDFSISLQFVIFTDGDTTGFFYIYGSNTRWTYNTRTVCIGHSYGVLAESLGVPNNTVCYGPGSTVEVGSTIGRSGFSTDYWVSQTINRTCPALALGYTTPSVLRSTATPLSENETNLLPAPQTSSMFPSSFCFGETDDRVVLFDLLENLNFGGCNYSKLVVSSNGYAVLALNSETFEYHANLIRLTVQRNEPMIAMFNSDLFALRSNSICITTHNAGDDFLNVISTRFLAVGGSSVNATYAIVITFHKIADYSNTRQQASFQLVLFTDGAVTYALVLYASNNPAWVVPSNNVRVGFSYGRALDPESRGSYWRTFDSETINFQMLGNSGYPGVWFFDTSRFSVDPSNCSLASGSEATSTLKITTSSAPVERNLLPSYQTHQTDDTIRQSDTYCLPPQDDGFRETTLQPPMPIMCRQYSSVIITTNGAILFEGVDGRRVLVPLSRAPTPTFLPFNTDLNPEQMTTVCYTWHRNNNSYFGIINERLRQLNQTTMSITSALVVTYYRIREFASPQTISFQFVIFTDGVKTRFMYLFSSLNAPWSTAARNVQFGYSFGMANDITESYTLSTVFGNGTATLEGNLGPEFRGQYLFDVPDCGDGQFGSVTASDSWSRNIEVTTWGGSDPSDGPSMPITPSPSRWSPNSGSVFVKPHPELSPLSICSVDSDAVCCRCRPPYLGNGDECYGANAERIMFPLPSMRMCLIQAADYTSELIQLNYRIRFGGMLFSGIQVASRGYVLLSDRSWVAANWASPRWEAVKTNFSQPFFAPYGGNLAYYPSLSSACYVVISRANTTSYAHRRLLSRADWLIRNLTSESEFSADQVVIINYNSMVREDYEPRAGSPVETVTAQAVLISNQNRTYLNLNYPFADYTTTTPLSDQDSFRAESLVTFFDASGRRSSFSTHSAEQAAQMRSNQGVRSSIVNVNAFDQAIGNTGILGSWLLRVDTDFNAYVANPFSNPVPQ